MVKPHTKEKASASIAFTKGHVPSGAGVLNGHSRLVDFREKPSIPNVCIAVYLFTRETLEAIEALAKDRLYTALSSIDKGRHLNPKLLESKRDYGPVLGYASAATYIDTGSYTGIPETETRLETLL